MFTLDGVVESVTDGDTVRVTAGGLLFKTRVLGLDTEESQAGNAKPKTRWGVAAADFVKGILPPGSPVTLEFPGAEPAIVDGAINVNYLDNFERPLAHLHLATAVEGTTDLSELMIRKGFSPYFVKYGRALSPELDRRYRAAEALAQRDDIGVWNQFLVNGVQRPEDAPRNYARLMVWWELRARVVDDFRAARAIRPDLLDTRLDYSILREKAAAGETATVFMEIVEGRTVAGLHHVILSGSRAQPFKLFMPNEDRPEIVAVKRLLANRYIASGEDFPRRNYAFVTGPLKEFGGEPEMVVTDAGQIGDAPP